MARARLLAKAGADSLAEFFEARDVASGSRPRLVGSKAQHQLRAASHGLIVGGKQFIEALEGGLVVGMPEPVLLTQGRVGFNRTPAQIIRAGR